MKIKLLITLCFFSTLSLLKSQNQNFYNNPSIGWSINLPKDFKNQNQNPVQIVETKDKSERNKDTNKKLSEKHQEVRFQGKNNTYFFTSFDKYNSNKNYSEFIEKQNQDLIDGFRKAMPKAKFDKNLTQENIDDLKFYKTTLKIDLGNNSYQNFIIYSALIHNFHSNFSIIYVNPTTESEEIIEAFKNSKFSK